MTAGVVVRGWAYQDLALDVHRLCGSQELEGLKCETGKGMGATVVNLVGVVHSTSTGETLTALVDSPTEQKREEVLYPGSHSKSCLTKSTKVSSSRSSSVAKFK